MGLESVLVPVLLPFSTKFLIPLAPDVTSEDQRVIENITKITAYLTGQTGGSLTAGTVGKVQVSLV